MHRYHRRGFTIVELLVVIVIISILVTASVLQYGNLQMRDRDANRRDSVSAYRVALEQFKSVNGFYVIDSKNDAIDPTNPSGPAIPVGFNGAGWGRMTRKSISPSQLGPAGYTGYASIADSLQQHGYLASVRSDPRLPNFYGDIGGGATQDFYLVVCTATQTGVTNASPTTGQEYTIFAHLEVPTATDISQSAAARRCSAPAPNDVTITASHFNYSVGSISF